MAFCNVMKRFFSIALAFSLFLSLFSFNFSVIATAYSPDLAIDFAEKNVTPNTGWQCAEFVSRCLYAGGLTKAYNGTSPIVSASSLWNAICGDSTEYLLTVSSDNNVYLSTNAGRVSPGDPIFWRCSTCNQTPHTILCTDVDSDGVLLYCAKNDNHLNDTLGFYNLVCSNCNTNCNLYSLHIIPDMCTVNVNFRKNSSTWSNPNVASGAYLVNQADSSKTYPLQQSTSAAHRYIATVPYGTYSLRVNNGTGTVVTAHTVTANSPTKLSYLYYYTLSYNANGGSGSLPSEVTRLSGYSATIPSASPTRTGHTFAGWGTSASSGVVYEAGDSVTISSKTTLYAQWVADQAVTATVLLDGAAYDDCWFAMELRNTATGAVEYLNKVDDYDNIFASDGAIPVGTYDVYVESYVSGDFTDLIKTGSTFTLSATNRTLTVNYYTVDFIGNGHTSGTAPEENICARGLSMAVPGRNTLQKTGKKFCYWREVGNSNSVLLPGTTHTVNQTTMLQAMWCDSTLALGDVDNNGVVNTSDAQMVLRYCGELISLNANEQARADFDMNGQVTTTDATWILRAAAAGYLAMQNGNQIMNTGTLLQMVDLSETVNWDSIRPNGEPLTWDDLNWDLLDLDAIDWDTFTVDEMFRILTGTRNPNHEIM